MLDPTTKTRMALGLQKIPCPSCKHAAKEYSPSSPNYSSMWCEKLRAGYRAVATCIPNTYNHFEPLDPTIEQ